VGGPDLDVALKLATEARRSCDRQIEVRRSCERRRGAITRAHHEEWARVVAALTRRFGDLDIAEERRPKRSRPPSSVPADGLPANPGAWLTTTATRKAIDRIRRENKRDDKHKEAQLVYDNTPPEPLDPSTTTGSGLIFTCCHRRSRWETRVALTLRMVGGLTVPEIARAFLVQETTMGSGSPARRPDQGGSHPVSGAIRGGSPARVSGVLAVLFLVFNRATWRPARHRSGTARPDRRGDPAHPPDPCLIPDDGEVAGLLALMLLTEARRPPGSRRTANWSRSTKQDRAAWDTELIAEGHRLVRERLAAAAAGVAPGRYQILAAINAVHTSARDIRDTDWSQVLALYDQLVRLDPSPIVALNRPSRWPSSTARRWHWRPSTGLRTRWPASRLPRHPRRPAAPAGPESAVARGVRPGHRAGRQHRRDRLPDPPPRPVGVAGIPTEPAREAAAGPGAPGRRIRNLSASEDLASSELRMPGREYAFATPSAQTIVMRIGYASESVVRRCERSARVAGPFGTMIICPALRAKSPSRN